MQPFDLGAPPPPAEPLGEFAIGPGHPVTTGDLTLAFDAVFTPERVGATTGTTAMNLIGRFGDDPQTPGTDYQRSEPSERMDMDRSRLGHYRWRITELTMAPPRVRVAVDRVAALPEQRENKLRDGDSRVVWLSTRGVQNLALAHGNIADYSDYLQVELGIFAREREWPATALVRARRVLADYETAYWECMLDVGAQRAEPMPTSVLGDHRITLLEVVWPSDSPADFHARIWLQRGTTSDGMTRAEPWQPVLFVQGSPPKP